MTNTFNRLLHGDAGEAADILSGDNPPDSIADLRAALTNALNRIDRLEQHVDAIDYASRFSNIVGSRP